jgi:hypothetical protein
LLASVWTTLLRQKPAPHRAAPRSASEGSLITLLPSSDFGIRGHPGNLYAVNEVCAHPSCGARSAHAHHLWARSHLAGQPYDWVSIPVESGGEMVGQERRVVLGNRLGFCVDHHNDVTGMIGGHRARIVFEDGIFYWEDRWTHANAHHHPGGGPEEDTIWRRLGPLTAQPPVAGELHPTVLERYEVGTAEAHGHASEEEEATCPTCGHHKPKPSAAKIGKPRVTKDWTIAVPDDSEVGAELLDEWIEDFAIVFGMSHFTSRLKRYHVLSVLRGVTLAMRSTIIKEVAEAAGRRLLTQNESLERKR